MKLKNGINRLLLVIVTIACSQYPGLAQDSSKVDLDFSTDMVSRYVWRGTQFGGASPSIQPYIELGIGSLVFGAWGAYSLGGVSPFQELDIYASLSIMDDQVSITVTDYFFPDESVDYDYFNYEDTATGHVFEGSASYNGSEKFPFSALIAVNFYGADAMRMSDDTANLNAPDGIQYSTYLEFGYWKSFKSVEFSAFLGVNLTDARPKGQPRNYLGETGFYGDDIGVVNLGITVTKEMAITEKFSLPLMFSLITNPQAEKIYMVFGFSL